jgi:exopolyphosphatase/guanosine-5'-triphosphate,3'-diphosphate pyrophosphatase
MGSNSLKLYLVPRGDGPVETVKFPWRVAHDHYRAGVLDPATADEVVERVRQAARLLEERHASGTLAIATGVFRELAELDAIAERLVGETGVRPRVISGADEAALMARGFREIGIGAPAVMCDLGGGSLEWAFEPPSGEVTSGSLPLGAIRCTYRFARAEPASDAYLSEAHAYCDALLAPLPIAGPARLVATGGTAEALATVVGHGRVRGARIDALVERVRREGPPAGLGPARRPVFLAGLVILSRVAARCGSDGLEYGTSAVRIGMVRRLVQLLERFAPAALHATQLLGVTRQER